MADLMGLGRVFGGFSELEARLLQGLCFGVRKKENNWVFGGVLPEKEENERGFWVAGDWPEFGGRVVISAFFYYCFCCKIISEQPINMGRHENQ